LQLNPTELVEKNRDRFRLKMTKFSCSKTRSVFIFSLLYFNI